INNFEKDLDVTREDNEDPSSKYISDTSVVEEAVEEHTDEEVAEKKIPQFTAPENTYEHDPGAHPVDEDEYSKYGYNDHSVSDQVGEPNEGAVENTGKEENKPSEQS